MSLANVGHEPEEIPSEPQIGQRDALHDYIRAADVHLEPGATTNGAAILAAAGVGPKAPPFIVPCHVQNGGVCFSYPLNRPDGALQRNIRITSLDADRAHLELVTDGVVIYWKSLYGNNAGTGRSLAQAIADGIVAVRWGLMNN